MWNFERFQCLTLKQIFWKTETLFKKLKYRFLVQSTKIENVTCKNALSEANVKPNTIGSTKWSYHKDFFFILRTWYTDLIWCTNQPNVHIHTFRKHGSFILGYFFKLYKWYQIAQNICLIILRSKVTMHFFRNNCLFHIHANNSSNYTNPARQFHDKEYPQRLKHFY